METVDVEICTASLNSRYVLAVRRMRVLFIVSIIYLRLEDMNPVSSSIDFRKRTTFFPPNKAWPSNPIRQLCIARVTLDYVFEVIPTEQLNRSAAVMPASNKLIFLYKAFPA